MKPQRRRILPGPGWSMPTNDRAMCDGGGAVNRDESNWQLSLALLTRMMVQFGWFQPTHTHTLVQQNYATSGNRHLNARRRYLLVANALCNCNGPSCRAEKPSPVRSPSELLLLLLSSSGLFVRPKYMSCAAVPLDRTAQTRPPTDTCPDRTEALCFYVPGVIVYI